MAAAATVLARVSKVEDINSFPWYPDDAYASQEVSDAISPHSALSGPGNDDQGFAHLRPIINIDIGGRSSVGVFSRRIVDEPDRFRRKCLPVGVNMTCMRLVTAGVMRQHRRTRMEEANRVMRQFGATLPGEVEGLTACTRRATAPLRSAASTPATR